MFRLIEGVGVINRRLYVIKKTSAIKQKEKQLKLRAEVIRKCKSRKQEFLQLCQKQAAKERKGRATETGRGDGQVIVDDVETAEVRRKK